MQCASFTSIPMSLLVYTRLQMAFSLWTTRILADTKCALFDFCQYCHPQRTLLEWLASEAKQLDPTAAVSKLCGSRSTSQVRLTSAIIWDLRLLTTFSLTSFSISVSTVTRKERLLNDKPLKRSNLVLQRRNQWRNSKLCGSRSSSARNEWINCF